MAVSPNSVGERFPAPPNLPPGPAWRGRLSFSLRKIADLQVASVLHELEAWMQDLTGPVLEVGCGAQPYRHLLPSRCVYQGLDWDQAETCFSYRTPDTTYYSGGRFPFPDATFAHLFHTEVIEHVFETREFLNECYRVIAPGGTMFFSVPFQARYHYIPNDFWRFTPASLQRLAANAGFEEIAIQSRGTDVTVATYKVLALSFRWIGGGLLEKGLAVLCAPLAIAALAIGRLSLRFKLGSSDDCLGYAVVCRKPLSEKDLD